MTKGQAYLLSSSARDSHPFWGTAIPVIAGIGGMFGGFYLADATANMTGNKMGSDLARGVGLFGGAFAGIIIGVMASNIIFQEKD